MKYIFYFIYLACFITFGQSPIEAALVKTHKLNAETLVSIDNFGSIYFVKNDVFKKNNKKDVITYNNLQLGQLYSVNTFNPLKINLFYKDFNTIIILDNRLAEIYKVDFNALTPFRNVSLISTGYDNTIWLFNQELQKLELFDYKTRSTRIQTVPVQSGVLDLVSNYNYCWLLTEAFLYQYNYFGRLVSKMPNKGYIALKESNNTIFLSDGNNLFCLKKNEAEITPVDIPNLSIDQFSVTNETLYIYNNETIKEFQLKIN